MKSPTNAAEISSNMKNIYGQYFHQRYSRGLMLAIWLSWTHAGLVWELLTSKLSLDTEVVIVIVVVLLVVAVVTIIVLLVVILSR